MSHITWYKISARSIEHRNILENTKLRAFALVATPEGQARIDETLRKFRDLDIDFRAAEVLSPSDRAFPADLSGWERFVA